MVHHSRKLETRATTYKTSIGDWRTEAKPKSDRLLERLLDFFHLVEFQHVVLGKIPEIG